MGGCRGWIKRCEFQDFQHSWEQAEVLYWAGGLSGSMIWAKVLPTPFSVVGGYSVTMSYVVSDSLRPHGMQRARLVHPWDFPGKNTGVGCHCLLQRIFSTQGSNPHLLHWKVDSFLLSHQRSPLKAPKGCSFGMIQFFFQSKNFLKNFFPK